MLSNYSKGNLYDGLPILLPKKKNVTFGLSIAQLTDIHLFADDRQSVLGVSPLKSFQAVLERLRSMRQDIDLLLLTGDLSGDGKLESYETLQELVASLELPVYWLSGDRDNASAMEEVLNLRLVSRRKSFERGNWNFVLLDSSVPGIEQGYLSIESLKWLDSQLRIALHKPTVVALHHPPFPIDSDWLDKSSLYNCEDFFAVLDKHPQVKLVLFGHIHQEFCTLRNNIHYLGTPSTCVQFQPGSSKLALDQKSPGFRILNLYPNGSWETCVERVSCCNQVGLTASVQCRV